MNYDWQTALIALVIVIGVSVVGKYLAFRMPALERMREYNREQDRQKLAISKYLPVVKANVRVVLGMNILLFLGIIPLATVLG